MIKVSLILLPVLLFLHFSKECVVDNLDLIGITLSNGETEICKAIDKLKSHENDRRVLHSNIEEISKNFDQEEKELAKEEEVDKLIINSLCSEIMDEVMDLDSAYPSDCKTIPRKKSPRRSHKGKRSGKENIHWVIE
jgi:hypothetical protein